MGKRILGLVLILGGIALGLWLGLWVCFFGGIASIIEGAKANPVDQLELAWGIIKFLSAWAVGLFSAIVLVMPGIALVMAGEPSSPRKH